MKAIIPRRGRIPRFSVGILVLLNADLLSLNPLNSPERAFSKSYWYNVAGAQRAQQVYTCNRFRVPTYRGGRFGECRRRWHRSVVDRGVGDTTVTRHLGLRSD